MVPTRETMVRQSAGGVRLSHLAVLTPRTRMKALYFLQYAAVGALFPLWASFYQNLGLSGRVLGLLLSVTPVAGIAMPPVWGLLGDRYRLYLPLLAFTAVGAGVAALALPLASGLALLFPAAALLAAFQSAWSPIGDSVALEIVHREGYEYGRLRLWGSIGFALASLATGAAAGRWGLPVIFPVFAAAAVLSALLVPGMPSPQPRHGAGAAPVPPEYGGDSANGTNSAPSHLAAALRRLLTEPAFLWLMLACFSVTGAVASHNYFFGILYQDAGGSLTGVGLTFLLFALSEVPVMLFAQGLADRYSPAWLLLAAALLADVRWFLYAAPVPPWVLVATFPLNGLSNGVFLALVPVLTSQLAGPHLKATALAAAGVAGFGLGAIFTSTLGGMILDRWSAAAIYAFLGLLGVVGVAASAMVVRLTPSRRQEMDA